jgi:hypothetical protein
MSVRGGGGRGGKSWREENEAEEGEGDDEWPLEGRTGMNIAIIAHAAAA